jgi:hypothetical protein
VERVTGIETSMASLGGCGSWARSGAGTAAGRVVVQCWRAWKPVFRRVGELAFGAYDHDAKGSTTNQEYYRVRGYSIAVWRAWQGVWVEYRELYGAWRQPASTNGRAIRTVDRYRIRDTRSAARTPAVSLRAHSA